MRIYLDGTAFSDLINFGTAINNSAKPLEVGFRFDGGLGGEVDELRISDFARYTGPTYAVPTAPFTCDEHTRALWHFDEFEGATVFHDACGVVDNLLVGYNGAHTERVPAGMLRVVTSPAVKSTVSANGIIRNDWGLDWTEVPAGQYTVSFSDVPGFITPDPQVVTVTEGATTVVTGVFSPVAYLRVTTVGWPPGETPTISVDGQPVNTWGLWVGLPPGSYTVSFEVIPGLTTPCSKVVTLTGGTTTHVEGNYSNGSCNIVP
jgi:hypothetical protein